MFLDKFQLIKSSNKLVVFIPDFIRYVLCNMNSKSNKMSSSVPEPTMEICNSSSERELSKIWQNSKYSLSSKFDNLVIFCPGLYLPLCPFLFINAPRSEGNSNYI